MAPSAGQTFTLHYKNKDDVVCILVTVACLQTLIYCVEMYRRLFVLLHSVRPEIRDCTSIQSDFFQPDQLPPAGL